MIVIDEIQFEEMKNRSTTFKICITPYQDGKYIVDDEILEEFKQIKELDKQIKYNLTLKFLTDGTTAPFDAQNLVNLGNQRKEAVDNIISEAKDKRYILVFILDLFIVVILVQPNNEILIYKLNRKDEYILHMPICIDLTYDGYSLF